MTGFSAEFFAKNRERAYDALKGSVLIVPAYAQMQRGNDAAFYFEQEANFWYLTGIDYPDWWLFMDGKRRKSWLVSPSVDERHQIFDGSLRREDAQKISGINEIIDRSEADSWLRQAARAHRLVYTVDYPAGHEHFDFTLNPTAREMHEKLSRIFATVSDFRIDLAKIRAIKQDAEIDAMQRAINLTIKGFERIKSNISKYKFEYEIEADYTHEFRFAGANGHAYDPIVAFGQNACTLHYVRNETKLRKGQMILLDVGAKVDGYSADITRTYAYGKVIKRQQEVHDAVRQAQAEIIKTIKPGLRFEEYFKSVDHIMEQALVGLNLMRPGDEEKYRKYFPHSIGHGLGIDVHDALGRPEVILPGMVMTVEPGIYIPEENIGVRIEDDILVTKTGFRNMSVKLPTDL